MKSEYIIGTLAVITLCGIIIFTILRFDTSVLVPIFSTLIGYLVGTKRDQIGAYLGGKSSGRKK